MDIFLGNSFRLAPAPIKLSVYSYGKSTSAREVSSCRRRPLKVIKPTAIKSKSDFFASEHMLFGGPQGAGQDGVATYKD